MQIKTDDQGYIVGYASVGGIVGGAEVEQSAVPQDFEEDFFSRKWRVSEGGMIVLSGESRPPEPEPAPDPVAQLLQRVEEQDNALIELADLLMGGGA